MDRTQPSVVIRIKDRGACTDAEAFDPNNLLALTPAMQSLVNGGGFHDGVRVGRPPKVHIKPVCLSTTPTPCPHGVGPRLYDRYFVLVSVCSDDIDICNTIKQLCRTEAMTDGPFKLVPVYVRDPLAFQGYLNWRLAHS